MTPETLRTLMARMILPFKRFPTCPRCKLTEGDAIRLGDDCCPFSRQAYEKWKIR